MPTMNMVQALNSAMDVMLARDPERADLRRGCRLFRRRVPRHRRPAEETRRARACFDTPIAEGGIVGGGDRHGRLWPAAGRRDPVRRLHLSRRSTSSSRRRRGCAIARPASSGAPITVRTPYGGGIFGGQTHSQSPEALFTHVCGPEDGDPVQSLRRQGPADQRDRGRRPGDLPRAQAPLQRPVRRPSRPAGDALGAASGERSARGLLHRAARQGGDRARGQRRHGARLWHDGACRARRRRGQPASTPR